MSQPGLTRQPRDHEHWIWIILYKGNRKKKDDKNKILKNKIEKKINFIKGP
jgi:hypothetical protein